MMYTHYAADGVRPLFGYLVHLLCRAGFQEVVAQLRGLFQEFAAIRAQSEGGFETEGPWKVGGRVQEEGQGQII